jgi:hypothetical protein
MFFSGTDPFSSNIKRRNYPVACLSGKLTGLGWWLMIDILVRSNDRSFPRLCILPGVSTTLMLIVLHCISNTALQGEMELTNLFHRSNRCDCHSVKCARFSLFLGFLTIFSAVCASVWIFITAYVTTGDLNRKPKRVQWFGIGNMVFTILLAVASLLSRFGRQDIG